MGRISMARMMNEWMCIIRLPGRSDDEWVNILIT